MQYCLSCFHREKRPFKICPQCGMPMDIEPKEPVHLKPGTILQGRYLVGRSVGAGGFGVVYKAFDLKLEVVVAVKEFFMSRLTTRTPGNQEIIIYQKGRQEFDYRKERFLAEARAMALFNNHESIPYVYNFFEENGTAYIAMELLHGQELSDLLRERKGKLDTQFSLYVIEEVSKALISMHEKHIIHRDVAPDNIFIDNRNSVRVILLDLGAGKLDNKTDEYVDIILKPGYSPVEQYDKHGKIGTWTDVYALGATLYRMVTGLIPEESTNRKIEDNLIPPAEINQDISENLSNAIMRAMAIDQHLRYRTVTEFLEAIRGERKVVSIAEEKAKRNRRRWGGVVAACLLVLVAIWAGFKFYEKRRADEGLLPTSIEVWCSTGGGDSEEAAMQSILRDFMNSYEGVSVSLRAIPEEDYAREITAAAEENRLPSLFESTGLGLDILEKASNAKEVIDSEQAKKCLFLNQYDFYYPDGKQIPLGIEVPMAWIITRGKVQVSFDSSFFSSLQELTGGEDIPIAADNRSLAMLENNFTLGDSVDMSAFLNSDYEQTTAPVFLTSTMSIAEVREVMKGVEKQCAYYKSDSVNCRFTYEWSIGQGDERQQNAAGKLLSWMLGESFQNSLMITENSAGQIPLSKESFIKKCEGNQYLSPIMDIYSSFMFRRQ